VAALRARGVMIAVVRVATSPSGQQLDVAHSQKRAFETAVATELARKIIGRDAKVEFRELGRDRWGPVERGEADIAMVALAEAPSSAVVLSTPYATGGIVLAVAGPSAMREPAELKGQVIAATTMGEVNASELARTYLSGKSIAATVQPVPGLAAAVAALDSGGARAVVGDRTGIAVLQRGRTDPLRVIAEVSRLPYVVVVRKDAGALHAAVDAALRELLSSGELARLATAAAFPYEAP
jgi:ABC-type amino acid transport substrate-binding protein